MAVSRVHIWNMALGFVGTRTIASEAENCEEARACVLYWDAARRASLRDFPWPFAQMRAALAQKPVPQGWKDMWRYAHALPDDCVKLHSVGDGEPFQLARGDDGTIVLCNAAQVYARYTVDVPSPAQWDDNFAQLMARRLATFIAVPLLKNNTTKVNELEQLARAAVPQAMEPAASEQKDREEEDSWFASRS